MNEDSFDITYDNTIYEVEVVEYDKKEHLVTVSGIWNKETGEDVSLKWIDDGTIEYVIEDIFDNLVEDDINKFLDNFL